ncbi:MAG: flagellar hook-length control protein FliK [Spirochaetales bacterium]|nr:flagellar hook-length control protein FliK [Spirochaetales bacterium]
MLQIIQNGLNSAKTSLTDNTLVEKNIGEQFSTSFDEIFQSAQTEKNQKAEVIANENSKAEDFSDVMRVCDENINIASEYKKNNDAQERPDTAVRVNKKPDKSKKMFDKAELPTLLSKKQDKKANVHLEINLERFPKNVSLKIKNVIAEKSGEKADIEKISHDIGVLLLSQFQVKEKNTNKKVTSETFAKNVASVALKDGKLILKGSEKLKQLKITGKAESLNKENQLSVGLKELLFFNREQTVKSDVPNNKTDDKIEALSVNNNNVKADNFYSDKAAVTAGKDKNQKMLLSKVKSRSSNAKGVLPDTKDALEVKNGIKENFSMPINNKQADSEMLAKSFQEQKTALYEQVTKQTKVLLTSDKVSFSTFVRPEEIGRVDFKFTAKDGKVNGKIILQNQDAADLFRSSVEDLRAVFQRANVELDKLEIQIAGRQTFETGNFDFSGNSNNAAGERDSRTQEKMADVSLHHAVKAFDDGASVVEKGTYSGNGIHLVI